MKLTLTQYAKLLKQRGEPCPCGPEPVPYRKAKPSLPHLQEVRAAIFGGYGTLMLIDGGEPFVLNPDPVMRSISLDKTIQEFKMWASMSRKPGEPHAYMASMIQQVLDRQTSLESKDAQVRIDKVWRGILDRLVQKEYHYDQGTYGDLDDYAQKICYYYLMRSQGVSLFPKVLSTLRHLHDGGIHLGIHADGQCNSPIQLLMGLAEQGPLDSLDDLFHPQLQHWSYLSGIQKGSDRSFKQLVKALSLCGVEPEQTLYIGADIAREIAHAKRFGFQTALFLGDRKSSQVTPECLKSCKPRVLFTEYPQLLKVLKGT